MPERVRDQVREHLADPHRVYVDDRQVARRGVGQRHAGGRRGGPERADRVGDEQVERGRFAVEGERAGLGQGQRPEVVDQSFHEPGLIEDRGQVRLVGRVDAIHDRLEIAGDHGQGRP